MRSKLERELSRRSMDYSQTTWQPPAGNWNSDALDRKLFATNTPLHEKTTSISVVFLRIQVFDLKSNLVVKKNSANFCHPRMMECALLQFPFFQSSQSQTCSPSRNSSAEATNESKLYNSLSEKFARFTAHLHVPTRRVHLNLLWKHIYDKSWSV